MKHFVSLIDMIKKNVSKEDIIYRLHQIFYQSIKARKVLSYAVRIEEFDQSDLEEMKREAKMLFAACFCLTKQLVRAYGHYVI